MSLLDKIYPKKMLPILRMFRRRLAYTNEYENILYWMVSYYDALIRYFRKYFNLPFFDKLISIRIKNFPRPFFMRLGRADWYIFEEIFLRKIYHHIFLEYTGKIDTIIDLGANVGFTVRLWKHRWPQAIVWAIEPEQYNFRMCNRNTTHLDRIHIIRACIGGSARPVKLKLGLIESNFQMEEIESILIDAQTLEAITIPMLLRTHNIKGPIDLLKCDIEGVEAEVFSNCSEWIQKVNNLLIELHGTYTIKELMNDILRNGGEFSYKLLPYSSGTNYILKKKNK